MVPRTGAEGVDPDQKVTNIAVSSLSGTHSKQGTQGEIGTA